MNFKKTLFGFGAATVLSLSMMSGAMAATTTGEGSKVELEDGGTCDAGYAVNQDGSNDFGTFSWDGGAYVGGDTAVMHITAKNTTKEKDCDLLVWISSFKKGQDTFDTTVSYMAPDASSAIAVATGGTRNDAVSVWSIPNGENGMQDHEMTMTVPSDVNPGKYTATVFYTAAIGQ